MGARDQRSVKTKTLLEYLNQRLNVESFIDSSYNGLQVEGSSEVHRVVTGVSSSDRLFASAIKRNADAIIVHHGLFWRGDRSPLVVGILKERLKRLLIKDVNLLAYHLPLDAHPEIGNNVLIAQALGLKEIKFFPVAGSSNPPLMAIGLLDHHVSFEGFCRYADEVLKTSGISLRLAKFEVLKVAIVSGGGSAHWEEAAREGADLLVTGDIKENVVRAAEEVGINLYAAGHYNTEKWGVRALCGEITREFGIPAEFIDIPNPI
ncbi:MAG: Nif3-like dinuclear metal center hexameric protein [bacterium]